MEEVLLGKLDANQTLNSNINIFKEAFIEYYGEEKRQEIEEKFSRVKFIGYVKPDRYEYILRDLYNKKSEEIKEKVNRQLTLDVDIFGKYDYKYKSLFPIEEYIKLKEICSITREEKHEQLKRKFYEDLKKRNPDLTYEKYLKIYKPENIEKLTGYLKNNFEYYSDISCVDKELKRIYENAEEFLKQLNPSITIENVREKINEYPFTELDKIIPIYEESKEEFRKYEETLKEYEKRVEETKEFQNKLREKYFQKYISENVDLIPIDKREGIDKFLEDQTKSYFLDSAVTKILGYSLNGSSLIEYFTEEYEEKLNNPAESKWIVDDIKRNRIEYFKLLGIDLGDNYEDYINNEEVQKLWPKKDRLERYVQTKNELTNKFNNEFFYSIGENRKILEEIETLNLLDQEHSFNPKLYTTKTGTMVNPNLRINNGALQEYSLLLVGFDSESERNDHDFVHELNHIFELSFKQIVGNDYEILCGWDIVTGKINNQKQEEVDTLNTEEPKREYELFNEIINELIAQDICKLLFEKGIHVLDDSKKAKYMYLTSYESSISLIKEFFEENKQAIIESRSNGNIQIIWDRVGKENFDALNGLFHEFNKHFQGFNYYNLLRDLKDKKETNNTIIFRKIIEKKNKIIDNIREYQSQKGYN